MSTTTGGIVGGIVGGVIGFFVTGGNPYGAVKGAMIGNAIGGAVDPPKVRTEGPRLQDKRVQGAEYGTPIPKVYGAMKVGGWLMWATDLEERATTTGGGKGGGSPKSTTYDAFFKGAFLLCEGPIVAIPRIWADGKILFDNTITNTGPQGGTVTVRIGGLNAKVKVQDLLAFGAELEIYFGSESQLPDPTMEAVLGVGNVPAYRGMAYVVISNLNLAKFGKRIPIFEFEIVTAGSLIDQVTAAFTLDRYAGDPTSSMVLTYDGDIFDAVNGRILCIAHSGTGSNANAGWQVQAIAPQAGTSIFSVAVSEPDGDQAGRFGHCVDFQGYIWFRPSRNLLIHSIGTAQQIRSINLGVLADGSDRAVAVNSARDELWVTWKNIIFVLDRTALLAGSSFPSSTLYELVNAWNDFNGIVITEIPSRKWMLSRRGLDFRVYDEFGSTFTNDFSIGISPDQIGNVVIDAVNDCMWIAIYNGSSDTRLAKVPFSTLSVAFSFSIGNLTPTYFTTDQSLSQIIYHHKGNQTIVWADASGNSQYTINVATQITSYGAVNSLVWCPSINALAVRFGEVNLVRFYPEKVQSNLVQLDDIAEDIILDCGVPPAKIDVTALTDTINGYVRDGRMQGRDALEPLRKVGFFDLIHSNKQIKAVKRGGAAVKTISYEELVMGDDGILPLGSSVSEDQDLASTIEVLYNDPAVNNEINRQGAVRPTQITGDIVEERIPVSMAAATARRIAEVMLYAGGSQRNAISLPLSRKHIDLEDSDAFNFTWPDATTSRMVAMKHDYQFPLALTIEAVEEDASAYANTAVGIDAGWIPPRPTFAGSLAISLLDIPILSDTHDTQGMYVVISADGVQTGTAGLFESVDNGVTYNSVGTYALQTSGYASTALASYTGLSWDTTSVVRVTIGSGTLESYTDIQVLNGRGAAILGNEMIQWRSATLVSALTYDLSILLRGRRGTEWAIGTHSAGERFVPLTSATPRLGQGALGQARLYKAGLLGSNIADASPVSFKNSQVGKKPFAPVYITGTRDGSLNLTGTFMRRSRIGSAWGSNIEIPLGEDLEKYEIDIMSGAVVKRTILATVQSFSYTAAEQTTDFGSAQSSILVNVYQMSLIVGRGYVGVATI